MGDEQNISYIDLFILDAIQKYGEFLDRDIAQKLHCPRTYLLSRLTNLIAEGLVIENFEKYSLSEKGLSQWIPLDDFGESQTSFFCNANSESFDWTSLYIPAKDWDNN